MKHFINSLLWFLIIFMLMFAYCNKVTFIGTILIVYLLLICVVGLTLNKDLK